MFISISQFIDVGIVTGIEANHKSIDKATKGMEVCIKVETITGETPKMYGRHFDYTDLLVSKVSFYSIFVSTRVLPGSFRGRGNGEPTCLWHHLIGRPKMNKGKYYDLHSVRGKSL